MSKGSKRRPEDKKKIDKNWDKIFKEKNMYKVLDACCGCKMMWFDKYNKKVLFADKRFEEKDMSAYKINYGKKNCDPDLIYDFRNMPFNDDSFYHVVFDPPHVRNISTDSVIGFSYGSLNKNTWQEDLKKGFDECFRVLKPNGTLIFKWNEVDIPISKILKIIDKEPLYGHRSGKTMKTHWVAFLKD